MEIAFLGTGSAYPSPMRGASCVVLKMESGSCWMFDCGEGSQTQVMRNKGVKAGKINKIFITHLHGDHMFGLPGLMCTVSQGNLCDETVEIYGPIGLRKFLRTSLELSRSMLGFSYVVHELLPLAACYPADWNEWPVQHESDDRLHVNEEAGSLIEADEGQVWQVYEDEMVSIKAGWLVHRIPSFGYVIEEKPIAGRLDVSVLKARGLPPGPLYAQLKQGKSVISPSGELIHPDEVVGPPRPGRKIVIMGDTSDSSHMTAVAMDADVLVHEATLEDGRKADAIEKGHSTPGMAATFAYNINAKRLILTHFSQRYKPLDAELKEEDVSVSTLVKQAKDVFSSEVIAAEDFLSVPVPRKS
ncbi:zinc phosphodiesterase ELAC protein 1-like [Lineus longissimus]|uniref:zinc phosphodiesterase ELAC protein 1-like n=1 Tax=Lineus longissimus TaxID=88925 RepID=UPI002B4F86B9